MQRKCWCFTLNNFTEEEYGRIKLALETSAKYAIIGKEVGGGSGVSHLQGYFCGKDRLRFGAVKSLLGDRCHIEPAKGNPQQNYDYCSKEGSFVVIGDYPTRRAAPIDLVCEEIRGGASLADIADKHMATFIRYSRGIQRVVEILGESNKREWKTE